MIAATSARKYAGVGIKRGDNAKEKVLQFVIDNYPGIEIQYTNMEIQSLELWICVTV